MICKLVTYGPDRQTALTTMCNALDHYVIRGVTNNISLLRDIATEPHFVKGDISTKYLPKIYPDGFKGKVLNEKEKNNLIGLAATVYAKDILRSREYLNAVSMAGKNQSKSFDFVVIENEKPHTCNVTYENHRFKVWIFF